MVKKRRGQSAAFMARIRKLRGKSHSKIKVKGGKTMVRRTVKRRTSRKSTNKLGTMLNTGLGVGGYILFESMIEPKIIQMAKITNPLIVNAVELAAGVWASRKPGVLGQVGKAAVVVNLYQILHPYLSTLAVSSGANNNNNLFN